MSIPLALSPVGYDTWVTELQRALITYLGSFDLVVDYLPNEKKLVVHTNQITEDLYNGIPAIIAMYIPEGVVLEQYNHSLDIPWQDWSVGYTQLAFLESTGTQVIVTAYVRRNGGTVNLDAQWTSTEGVPSGRLPAIGFIGRTFCFIANVEVYNCFWIDGTNRIYYSQIGGGPLDRYKFSYFQIRPDDFYIITDERTKWSITNSNGVTVSRTLTQTGGTDGADWTFSLFGRRQYNNVYSKMRIWDFTYESVDKTIKEHLVPAIDPNGTVCMYDVVTKKPVYNVGTGTFIAGVETLVQLQNMARNLPSTGGTRTVSMPGTFQTDTTVQEAIAAIEAKGWVLTKNYRTDETT